MTKTQLSALGALILAAVAFASTCTPTTGPVPVPALPDAPVAAPSDTDAPGAVGGGS